MLAALGPLLLAERPDVVLVYGDTNSTLAGGLAAAQAGVPVAHVEAGIGSLDPGEARELQRRVLGGVRGALAVPSPNPGGHLEGVHHPRGGAARGGGLVGRGP